MCRAPPHAGRSLELFAAELVTKAAAIAEKDNDVRKTLSAAHIKKCVETDPLFDFLRATVQQVPIALPQKRARAPSDAGAPKRSKTADGVEGADGQGKGASGDGDGSVASQLAVASNYRPLADCDDDYDAEDDG